jgi:hypothetical protein
VSTLRVPPVADVARVAVVLRPVGLLRVAVLPAVALRVVVLRVVHRPAVLQRVVVLLVAAHPAVAVAHLVVAHPVAVVVVRVAEERRLLLSTLPSLRQRSMRLPA